MFGGLIAPNRGGYATLFGAVLMTTTAMSGIIATEAVAQTANAQRNFDIPAQSLPQALMIFGRQAGLQVTAEGSVTSGKASRTVRGNLSPAEALSQMLTGTGLTFRFVGSNGVQIETAPQSADGAIELGPVRVESGAGASGADISYVRTSDPASTEGTGSYTTHSMATATKLPLSIRETPQAVTVLTRQRLDDQVLTSLTDVVKTTPGLFLSHADGPGRPSFSARGFDIDNIMYDGMPTRYQGWVVGSLSNMAIFDRVEVVRGATGLVVGSGNPSAAINLVRKRPTRDFQLSAEGAAGSWDNYRGQIDMSGPVSGDGGLRVRTIGSYQDSSTFRDGEKIHRGIFHAIAEYDVGPDTMLMAGYTRQDDFYNSFWGGLPLTETGEHMGLPRSTRPGYDWEGKSQKSDTLFGELTHHLGNEWRLRLAGMKTWQDAIFSGTYVYRRDDMTLTHSAYQASYDEDQTNLDAYISGPVMLFGRAHDVTIGASRRETAMRTQNYSGGGLLPGNVDMFSFDPSSGTKPNFVPTTSSRNVTTQSGLYGSVRLNPADALKLILGGRMDWYEYDNVTSATGDYKVNANVTFYAGLLYDVDRHHTLYVSYTDIFQPQTSMSFAADTASQRMLSPVIGKNYEAGLKGEYFDGLLNASIALFQIDQTNRAFTPTDQTGCPTFPSSSCAIAAGLVRSKGVDVEVQGSITPQWQISAGYTYSSIEFVRDTNPNNGGKNFSPGVPKNLFKLSTTYKLDRLTVGAGVYWQSRIYGSSDASGAFPAVYLEQKSYAVTDAMLGYKLTDKVDIQFNINNIFDKTYYKALAYDVRWGSVDAYGDPRNFLITLRAKY